MCRCKIGKMNKAENGGIKLKHYINVSLKMLWAHVKAQLFSVALGPLVFFIWLTSQTGWQMMGIATGIFYVITVYSAAYKIADKDIKSYSQNKPYTLKGVVISLLTLACTGIFALLYHLSYIVDLSFLRIGAILELVLRYGFRWWGFAFEGFRIAPDGSISVIYWLLLFLTMPIASFFGYFCGMKKIELSYMFFSRLVYKKEDKKSGR